MSAEDLPVWRSLIDNLDPGRPLVVLRRPNKTDIERVLFDAGWQLIGNVVVGTHTDAGWRSPLGAYWADVEEEKVERLRIAAEKSPSNVIVRTVVVGLEAIIGVDQLHPNPEQERLRAAYQVAHDEYWRKRALGLRPGEPGWEEA